MRSLLDTYGPSANRLEDGAVAEGETLEHVHNAERRRRAAGDAANVHVRRLPRAGDSAARVTVDVALST